MCNVNCTTIETKRQPTLGLLPRGGGGGGGGGGGVGVPVIDSRFFQLQNVISHPVLVVCTYCFRFSTSLDALYLKQ